MPDIDTNSPSHNPIQCMNCGSGPCIFPTLCGTDALKGPQKPNGNGHAHSNGHAKTKSGLPFRLPYQFTEINKNWLFKGLMARGEVSSWVGPPGGTKSMLLTDIAVHGAAGMDWRGKRCRDGFGVVYFALERGRLTERRIQAYKVKGLVADDAPLAVVSQIINLCDPRCVFDILRTVHDVELVTDVGTGLLIFDTYNKGLAAGGVDENNAFGQNIVAANMRRILERLDVHIAGIGHTGKNVELGERGSNARKADVDLEVLVHGYDGIFQTRVSKANDQDDGFLTAYRTEAVVLGQDEDGDEIKTFVLSPEEVNVAEVNRDRALPPRAQIVLNCIRDAIEADPQAVTSNYVPREVRCGWIGIAREYHRKRCPEANKGDFSWALNWLQARGLAGVWELYVWLP